MEEEKKREGRRKIEGMKKYRGRESGGEGRGGRG